MNKLSSKSQASKILIIQRIIPHYRIALFRRLSKQINGVVCASKEKKNHTLLSHLKNLDFPIEVLSRIYFSKKKDTYMVQNILGVIRKYKPEIIISEFGLGYLTLWMLLILKLVIRFKLIIWTHGIPNQDIFHPYRGLKGKLTLWIFNRADALIFYSNERKEIAEKYISKQIFVAPNAMDLSQNHAHHKLLKSIGKMDIKKKLGWESKYNIVFIGRLTKEKRIDLLVSFFKAFKIYVHDDVTLHIIGKGDELDKLKEVSHNMVYHGELNEGILKSEILFCCDFCLHPGQVGLSILDIFSLGLPLVTVKTGFKNVFHSPEIAYLEEELNGFTIGEKEGDVGVFKKLTTNEVMKQVSDHAFQTSCVHDIISTIRGFESAIEAVQNSNPAPQAS